MPIIVPSAVFVADASHGISPAWEQELRGVEDPDELQGESLDGVPRHAVRASLGFRPLPMAVDSTRRKSRTTGMRSDVRGSGLSSTLAFSGTFTNDGTNDGTTASRSSISRQLSSPRLWTRSYGRSSCSLVRFPLTRRPAYNGAQTGSGRGSPQMG
jgi:hypothetical protein